MQRLSLLLGTILLLTFTRVDGFYGYSCDEGIDFVIILQNNQPSTVFRQLIPIFEAVLARFPNIRNAAKDTNTTRFGAVTWGETAIVEYSLLDPTITSDKIMSSWRYIHSSETVQEYTVQDAVTVANSMLEAADRECGLQIVYFVFDEDESGATQEHRPFARAIDAASLSSCDQNKTWDRQDRRVVGGMNLLTGQGADVVRDALSKAMLENPISSPFLYQELQATELPKTPDEIEDWADGFASSICAESRLFGCLRGDAWVERSK